MIVKIITFPYIQYAFYLYFNIIFSLKSFKSDKFEICCRTASVQLNLYLNSF